MNPRDLTRKLKTFYNKEPVLVECPICMEDKNLRKSPCNHAICDECWNSMKSHLTDQEVHQWRCPTCRQDLTTWIGTHFPQKKFNPVVSEMDALFSNVLVTVFIDDTSLVGFMDILYVNDGEEREEHIAERLINIITSMGGYSVPTNNASNNLIDSIISELENPINMNDPRNSRDTERLYRD